MCYGMEVEAPCPPALQPPQMPKLLPLDWMKPQVDVMWVNSGAIKVAPNNGVSVEEYVAVESAVFWCSVARQDLRPEASVSGAIADGLQVAPTVAMALITIAVGMLGVSGLLIKAFTTDTDCNALGVTEHEQQPINSSAGSNT